MGNNQIVLFVSITAFYLAVVSGIMLFGTGEVDAFWRLLVKLIPTLFVIAVIVKTNSLRDISFDNALLSALILTGTILLTAWSIGRMEVFQNIAVGTVTMHISRNLVTSIFEEGLFRVILFAGLIQFFKNSSRQFWKAIALTALVFGAMHFINVLTKDYSVSGAFIQVVFAFGIGVFLQVIYVVSRNILLPICIHFVVNFFGSSGKLHSSDSMVIESGNPDLSSLIFMIAICAILVGLSVFIYRKEAFEKYSKALVQMPT